MLITMVIQILSLVVQDITPSIKHLLLIQKFCSMETLMEVAKKILLRQNLKRIFVFREEVLVVQAVRCQ